MVQQLQLRKLEVVTSDVEIQIFEANGQPSLKVLYNISYANNARGPLMCFQASSHSRLWLDEFDQGLGIACGFLNKMDGKPMQVTVSLMKFII